MCLGGVWPRAKFLVSKAPMHNDLVGALFNLGLDIGASSPPAQPAIRRHVVTVAVEGGRLLQWWAGQGVHLVRREPKFPAEFPRRRPGQLELGFGRRQQGRYHLGGIEG